MGYIYRARAALLPYITLFKIRIIVGLQYRIAAWAGLATQFAWGFLNIMLFYAFYTENPANFPMTFEQFAAHTWLNQALLMIFVVYVWDASLFDSITSGNIAYELARPADLYNMWLVKNMANRVAGVALRFLPVLAVAALLPKPFGLVPPADILTLGLFILSALLAFILVNLYCMFFYIFGFYTINSSGIRMLGCAVSDLLSGFIIPLPFYPAPVLKIIYVLPFASMQNVPLFIYSGYITKEEALTRIVTQLFWIIVFYISGRSLTKHALKRIVVQGG